MSNASKGVGIRKALGVQFASKYANVVVQLGLTAILARLLTPEQYGTVAIVTVFTTFFSIFADVGIAPAVIQFSDLTDEDLSGLLTFSGLLGAILTLVFFLVAYPISWAYDNPGLVPLCQVASISVLE